MCVLLLLQSVNGSCKNYDIPGISKWVLIKIGYDTIVILNSTNVYP